MPLQRTLRAVGSPFFRYGGYFFTKKYPPYCFFLPPPCFSGQNHYNDTIHVQFTKGSVDLKIRDRFPKVRLPWWGSLLAAVLLAGGITLLALWCQPNALRSVLAVFRGQPLLIILNALPIGLLLLAVSFLLRNVFYGAAVVNFAVCALSIANRIKIEVRDEPVFPRDFALLKEAGSAVGTYDIQFPVPSIAAVVVFSLVLVALGLFVGSRPFPIARLRGWVGSLLGAAASFAVLAGLILTVYASNDLYNSFRVSNAYYIPSVFNELGFPYCFCHQFTTYPVDKPEGFSRSEAAGWDQGGDTGLGKDVNVIMVMDEAFSDITDSDAFAFTAENDPLPNLHALREDPHAVAGHIVVPGFAGGTANTEFDVLTGMQTNALAAGTTSSFRVVNRNLDSLFRVFGGDGYHTSFFHPGDDWFYNRENINRNLGFEDYKFVENYFSTRGTTGFTTGRTSTAGSGRRRPYLLTRWRRLHTRAAGSRMTTWRA